MNQNAVSLKSFFSASVWSRQQSCFSSMEQQRNKSRIWRTPIQGGTQWESHWKRAAMHWHDQLPLRFTHYQQTAASVWAVKPDIKLLLLARIIGHWLSAFLFHFGWSVINMNLPMPHWKQTHWMFLRKKWLALELNWSPLQNWKEHLHHFSLEIPVKVEYICILSGNTSSASMILYAEVLVTNPLCFNSLFFF